MVDSIFAADTSVFSSGGYQRYFEVDGVSYNHIIDPRTFMPAQNFSSTTVIHPDGTKADILSTAIFILELDEGRELLARYNAEAIWILPDGEMVTFGRD